MFGLKGVGIVVLTSGTVRGCQVKSLLGDMSKSSRSNNVFTMKVQTRVSVQVFEQCISFLIR